MEVRKAGFIALAAAMPSLCAAGTYVESAIVNHTTPQAQPDSMKMWADNGRLRVEMKSGQIVQIFRDQVFYTLNPQDKSYTKLDKAGFEAFTQQANEAIKKLAQTLPPEQREKFEQQGLAAMPKIERSLKPTARTESSALGQACKVWEVFSNGARVQESCVIEVAKLPNGKELISTLRQVDETFAGTAASSGRMEVWQDAKTMNGFPVITRIYFNDKLIQEMKTTAMRAASTSDALFTIPAGFEERAMSKIE